MEFDLTTFLLEAINFLILVWLLKHFFYRPILSIVKERQAATAQTVSEAKSLRTEAEALKTDYEKRLAQIHEELTSARERLDEEVANERKHRLAALEADIDLERKRREALEERHKAERGRLMERKALGLAGRFAARLFDQLSSPCLNEELADLTIDELHALPPEKKEALRAALHDSEAKLQVISAYPLDNGRRILLTRILSETAGHEVSPEFSEDIRLKAGLCLMVGSWELMANLRDELSFFTESAAHA